jgi:hypothetical protein
MRFARKTIAALAMVALTSINQVPTSETAGVAMHGTTVRARPVLDVELSVSGPCDHRTTT